MTQRSKTWRQAAFSAAVIAIPTVLAVCVLTGRCGAEPPDAVTKRSPAPATPNSNTTFAKFKQLLKGDLKMQTVAHPKQTQGRVLHADAENFREIVLEADTPVLVDFYADWCGPCRLLAPVLEELAREKPDARVVKVNIDHAPELAQHYRVSSIPTVLVFKDGKPDAQLVGLAPKATLRQMLED